MFGFRCLCLVLSLVCSFAQGAELTDIRATVKQGVVATSSTGDTTPFIGGRGDFFIRNVPVQPQAELNLVAPGATGQNQPRLAFGAALRLDVLELVPFLAARIGVPLRTHDLTYGMLSVGIERLYRNDWFWLLEMGAQVDGSNQATVHGVFIFGFGVTYSLNELV